MSSVTERIDELARTLENKAGIEPGELSKDPSDTTKIYRIIRAVDLGALEAHALTAHTDVDLSVTPVAGNFLRFDGLDWVASTAALGTDLTDVAVSAPVSAQVLRYNGINWANATLVLGDLPAITLNDLNDVIVGSPAATQVLTYSGGSWVNNTIGLNELDDVTLGGIPLADKAQAYYDLGSTQWVNGQLRINWLDGTFIDHSVEPPGVKTHMQARVVATGDLYRWFEVYSDLSSTDTWNDLASAPSGTNEAYLWNGFSQFNPVVVIRADGTQPLTANWDVGNFTVEARKLIAQNTVGGVSFDTGEFDQTVTDTGFVSTTLRGVLIDQNYTFNDGAGGYAGTIVGVDIDQDFVHTASLFQVPAFKILRGNLNYGAFNQTSPAFDVTVTGTGSTASFGNAMAVFALTSAANTIRALRSEAYGSSTGAGATDVCTGYQGFATGQSAYTGNVIGVHGYTGGTHGSCRGTWGLLGQPDATASGIPADQVTAVGGLGHFFANGGSGIFVDPVGTAFDRPTDVTTTHLDFLNNTGELYVENDAEIDGIVFADGGITMAAQTLLTVGVYSDGTRPSAGTAGRVIFNTTDGNLNIDDGTNWILPDGTTT